MEINANEMQVQLTQLREYIDGIRGELNYYKKHAQLNVLYCMYQSFYVQNQIRLNHIKDNLKSRRKIRVLYYVYIIDQVSFPLINEFVQAKKFDILLLAKDEKDLKKLEAMGYNVALVNKKDYQHHEKLITKLEYRPDVVFSEMPYGNLPSLKFGIRNWMIEGNWLPDYINIFGLDILNSALFCYIPYGYSIAAKWGWLKADHDLHCHYGLPYQNFCWLYFLETEGHLEMALQENVSGNTKNYVVSGYPKYDVYGNKENQTNDIWRHRDVARIVYAPHFFRSDPVLERTCQALLDLAETGKFEVVLKPHPNNNSIIKKYDRKFEEHEYTHIIRDGHKTQDLIESSDILIVSSVSMHADAIMANKPFISELGLEHFNQFGREILSCSDAIISPNSPLTAEMIDNVLKHQNVKMERRQKLLNQMMPNGKNASSFIVQYIEKQLILAS